MITDQPTGGPRSWALPPDPGRLVPGVYDADGCYWARLPDDGTLDVPDAWMSPARFGHDDARLHIQTWDQMLVGYGPVHLDPPGEGGRDG